MEEQTTTEAPVATGETTINGIAVDDQGMAISQPENTEQAEAVQQTTEPEEREAEVSSEPSEDEQLAKFAETKGLQLDSDNAKKAAKMAMNAERLMHEKTVRASELERNIGTQSDQYAEQIADQTGQDPELLKRLQRVEVKEAVRDFWNTPGANGETPDKSLEPKMVEILQTKPHLAGDLESLYATAMVSSGKFGAAKSQGKREALESLAHKQQAAVPTGNAVNSVTNPQTITPQNVDHLVAQNDMAWFMKNRDAINAAMAG